MTADKRLSASAAAAALLALALAAAVAGCRQDAAPSAHDSAAGGLAGSAPQPGTQTPSGKGAQALPGARKAGDKPLWRALTPAQQQALLPLQGEWDAMDGMRKQKWLQLANRYATMRPEDQERLHERMRAWVGLTPEQRELARETYTRTRKIAPEQKTATWESYQQLPEDQKRRLAASSARKAPSVVPSQAGGKATAPLGMGATACPAGTVKNPVSATPPCVAAPVVPAAPGTAPQQPAKPANPAPPAQQEQQVPANWGITPNDA